MEDERQQEPEDPRELFECDVCRFKTYYLRCKYECPNCGARRDCSDP